MKDGEDSDFICCHNDSYKDCIANALRSGCKTELAAINHPMWFGTSNASEMPITECCYDGMNVAQSLINRL